MMEYQLAHPSTCCYCKHDELTESYIFGEDAQQQRVNVFAASLETEEAIVIPHRYIYFLHLMSSPDLSAYLSSSDIVYDDIYDLPIHLQRLVMEAKEELMLLNNERSALERLERIRTYIWKRSNHDFSNLMTTLNELVSDDDELNHLLGI
ncbi:uncharacterized protein BX663DRAFT_525134 [Cokeromyces recurvatus]|uniref:uncharacterized protein n=1 Tax=Cokeromyces recurvatus TaxID=90255 RepID=UPI00221EE7E7|nr:uncharacterized protein BX663DRAFT_525134 [Cokeromyces recurvatus]KAI7898390.1 hypothetical protein BX663DRAFT_525134 [Cokeromyces recurvatus]